MKTNREHGLGWGSPGTGLGQCHSPAAVTHAAGWHPSLTRALPPGTEMGLFTRVIVLVTPPTTVVTTWACWATVTVPDLCTVMMGRVDVLAAEETDVPTWAAAVFSMRVAGLLT